MTVIRGSRGATTAETNTREAILQATHELLQAMVEANGIQEEQIACVFFSATPDLDAAFPAEAARVRMGWSNGAFFSSQEMNVADAPRSCIRVLILVNTDAPASGIRHVYLRGAVNLRQRGLEDKRP
ncbi:MAG: chorismate mutase [Chloroflexi bacterium]|nr:chorismate mutase [Chloroflexota bacterium]